MNQSSRRWMIDIGIAAVVAAVLCIQAAAPFEQDAIPPDWRAYGTMVLIGGALLFRRRYPIGTLVASLLLLMAYYFMGFGAVGAVWPLSAALFNVALFGRWRSAVVFAGGFVVSSSAWRLIFEPEGNTAAVVSDILTDISLATAVILAGALITNQRQLRAEIRARSVAVAAEKEAEARSRMSEQRVHLAREVHDVVAHALAGIGVQAHLAEEIVDTDRDEARKSIRAIIDTTNDAIGQLRETVGSLRGAPTAPPVPPSLRDLVEGVVGVDISYNSQGDVTTIPDEIDRVVRAVVREALTNTVRHSGATEATVTLMRDDHVVGVQVADNGKGGTPVEGAGIKGMRERVAEVGGTLTVGSRDEGGFVLTTEIPI
ncbi:MAG: hypothetical protein GEU79_17460 [Acidimicrobiia bacterium]|nr:hypothetical protein [Acidimicrobiia bacterium]